jgi:cholest-4-en-3-one 26-monooxygenase
MVLETPTRPEDVNLSDERIFESGDPHACFRLLRREDPVHWNPGDEIFHGYWSLTKYEDVLYVSRHPELFISSRGITAIDPRDEELQRGSYDAQGKMLIMMDPPRHVKLRRLVNKAFTPRAVAMMAPHIRRMATDILDEVGPKNRVDFVVEVAAQLPLAVICGMMGLDKQDWPVMFDLTNKVLGSGDPEYQTDVPEEIRGTPQGAAQTNQIGFMRLLQFFAQITAQRRAQRKDDLVSILVDSEVDGEKLTEEEILWFCLLLILAGNETTRNGISGGLYTLCQHPAEKARLLADMSLMPSAVEEILRWTSPVTHMARVATRDVEIRGKQIKQGERVVMWYPSVNRDEDIFPEPDRFDITRSPNEHLAFGIGEHFCLGASFARLEMQVIFEELFRRFPDVALDGPIERLRSNFIGGIKHLPVRLTPAQ